jgi:hypothetical protein
MSEEKEWSPQLIEASARCQAEVELLRDLDPDVANGNHVLPPPVRERCLAIIAQRNPKLAARIRSGDTIPPERRFSYRELVELKPRLIRAGALVNLESYAAWGVDVDKPGGRELLALMERASKLL